MDSDSLDHEEADSLFAQLAEEVLGQDEEATTVDSQSEDDEDEDDEDEEDAEGGGMLYFLPQRGGRGRQASDHPPAHPKPLMHSLAQQLNSLTSGVNRRRLCDAPSLDSGVDAFTRELVRHGPQLRSEVYASPASTGSPSCSSATMQALQDMPQAHRSSLSDMGSCEMVTGTPVTTQAQDTQKCLGSVGTCEEHGSCSKSPQPGASGSPRTTSRKRVFRSSDGEAQQYEQPGGESEAAAGPSSRTEQNGKACSGTTQLNKLKLLLKRELGLGDVSRLSRAQQLHMQCQGSALPLVPTSVMAEYDERCYIGQFSRNGSLFICASQNQRVRVFDVERGWALRKEVRPRGVRWTITDTCTSPDQRFLLYCSINTTVHKVDISNAAGPVNSLANITEVHDALEFDQDQLNFGIWSVRWNRSVDQLIAGTNSASLYIYDIEQNRVVGVAQGHNDDVNAVEYLDESPNLILTGSDDASIKLWDRRQVGMGRRPRAVGVFVGHTEGLTHLNAKGDGRYWISNCKDQTIKLWDVRMGMKTEQQAQQAQRDMPSFAWDYRWMEYPGNHHRCNVSHPHDASIHTYKGHRVLKTLIRAYWSPAFTTGQRMIYSGSEDGTVHIWDVVTGNEVGRLRHHHALVRDASWHPTQPLLASVSWDGQVVAWSAFSSNQLGGKPIPARSAGH